MAVLGKCKASDQSRNDAAISDVFRRHFEAHFKPLSPAEETAASLPHRRVVGEDESDDEEWGGLSDDARDDSDNVSEDEEDSDGQVIETRTVEIVDHSSSQASHPTAMSKRELKLFMSSRPPDQTASPTPSQPTAPTTTTTLPEDAPSLLAQDLELRRLISESHLLSTTSSSNNPLSHDRSFAEGRTRQKATDLRVLALGSKTSVLAQDSMPMSMRKGIVAAAGAREAKRRRQARENGVVLEREKGRQKPARKRSAMGAVDRPGVGRLKGAELRVSERDVKKIEGTRDVFGRRNKR